MSEEDKIPNMETAPEKSPVLEKTAETAEALDEGSSKVNKQESDSVAEEQNSQEIPELETASVDPALVDCLTEGFLSRILPDLQNSKAMLEELMRNQQVLIETVDQENTKFNDCHSFQKLEETMKKARVYQNKLLTIKREMNNLHEKSARLKKRAVKLQQQKQKEELHRAHKRDKEVEREKMLEAKPAPRRQTTPAAMIDKSVIPEPSYSHT